FVSGHGYTCEGFRFGVGKWIAKRCRPYTIIDDVELQDLFHMLYAHVEIPSRMSVQRDIHLMMDLTGKCLIKAFAKHPDTIHIALDAWTSHAHMSFLALTAHRVDANAGVIRQVVLDFVRYVQLFSLIVSLSHVFYSVAKAHTGENLAIEVHGILGTI
ncbi:hypothetical protein M422DRAFT_190637, partial [Sphaerobolus stellatus SS14]